MPVSIVTQISSQHVQLNSRKFKKLVGEWAAKGYVLHNMTPVVGLFRKKYILTFHKV